MSTYLSTSKGISHLAAFMISVAFQVFIILAAVVFVKFFRYHVTMHIVSDATNEKVSLIPLVLISSTHDNKGFIVRFNDMITGVIGIDGMKKEVKESLDHYFDTNLCYRLKVEDVFEVDNFNDVAMGIEYGCEEKSFYKIRYIIPVVFDGHRLNRTLEFSVHKIEIAVGAYP